MQLNSTIPLMLHMYFPILECLNIKDANNVFLHKILCLYRFFFLEDSFLNGHNAEISLIHSVRCQVGSEKRSGQKLLKMSRHE